MPIALSAGQEAIAVVYDGVRLGRREMTVHNIRQLVYACAYVRLFDSVCVGVPCVSV